MCAYTSSWQVRVIGCGECGAKIAAMFDKKPSFLPRRTEDLYPVRCAIIDTDGSVVDVVSRKEWGWNSFEDIHILPVAPSSILTDRILHQHIDDTSRKKMTDRFESSTGIGGYPFLGRVSAEEVLLKETSERKLLKETMVTRGFIGGGLLTINSLSGGTGTGFSQVVSHFLVSDFFKARMNINLSIIPEGARLPQAYPRTMLYCLYHLLCDDSIDGIVLADNDVLRRNYNCKGNYEYNSLLHEVISPIFLAPSGRFSVQNFGSVLDGADIRRSLRPKIAIDQPELCSIGFATKKMPSSTKFKLQSNQQRKVLIEKYLEDLVKEACATTTTGEKANAASGLAIICGPPKFYKDILDNNTGYYTYLWETLIRRISPQFRLAALEFESMKTVYLIIFLSGTSSAKLTRMFSEVLIPYGGLPLEATLGDSIRQLDSQVIEDLMVKEIRDHLFD